MSEKVKGQSESQFSGAESMETADTSIDRRAYLRKLTTTAAISGIAAAGTVKWQKPVVSNVVLPSHAGLTEPNPEPQPEPPEPSDARLKTDIHPLHRTVNGHALYRFRYIGDSSAEEFVGVMAQDLLESRPDAVTVDACGCYSVYYGRLGLKMASLSDWEQLGEKAVKIH